MNSPSRASKISALLSGLAFGVGMPAIESIGLWLGLSQGSKGVASLFGLVFLFLGPVLMFVVGTAHLGINSQEVPKAVYWSSLRQVALRFVAWLVGCGLGFTVLSAVRGLSG